MEINWKELTAVAVAGALGGGLSLIYAYTRGAPPSVSPAFLAWPAYLLLGAGAGLLGVYVLAKTDTRQVMHCLGFALACGLSWSPVFEASSALIEKNQQDEARRTVQKEIEETGAAVEQLMHADGNNLEQRRSAVLQKVDKLTVSAARVNDLALAQVVDNKISDTIDTLQRHAKSDADANRGQVIGDAVSSLMRLKSFSRLRDPHEVLVQPMAPGSSGR